MIEFLLGAWLLMMAAWGLLAVAWHTGHPKFIAERMGYVVLELHKEEDDK